jgi:hypothetical protein
VRWIHRKPLLVTGFVPSAVEWLGSILQLINNGRLLSNPLRSTEPEEVGLENSFSALIPGTRADLMKEFWDDILSPAAVAEEADLYSSRSKFLTKVTFWPAPLTVADFRALTISPWVSREFRLRPIIIVPTAHQFVHEMKGRKVENRSIIRLENLKELLESNPSLCKLKYDELIELRHTSEQFAAVYVILTNFFAACARDDSSIIRISYEDIYSSPYQSLEYLIEKTGMRQRKEIGEALKAIRISYDGSNYQKIPHSPKDPTAWKTGLHEGQIEVVNEVLKELECPADGLVSWRAQGPDSESKVRIAARSTARSRKTGSARRETPPASSTNGHSGNSQLKMGEQKTGRSSGESRSSSDKKRSSGSSRSQSSSRSQRRDRERDRKSEDMDY